ncbi:ABC transporter permease [Fodinicurvata sp. EGI_FJ10296]|uniref:ABC transporter permease n=1 Tax=Fodinicurvata sp. EGI_FJ10296 TaxID=3231908 RepID=UPI00345310BF
MTGAATVRPLASLLRGMAVFAVAVGLWQTLVWATGVPHFILPGPTRVWQALVNSSDIIIENAWVTYGQILTGLVLGTALGVVTALQLAMSPMARLVMRPILVFAQAIPIFALAPILTLWLGYGMGSKIVMVMLIIYFPVASSFFDGLMRTPRAWLDLAQVMGAPHHRTLFLLRAPHALPSLASGLRLAAVYAPFGAVIGEWVGASKGLGYLMLLANGRAQTDLMFAALFALAAFTVLLYLAIDRAATALTRRFTEPSG